MPLVRFKAATRTVFMVHAALREKGCTLRTLHLLRRPALVVPNAPASGCFVVAVMVAILRRAVAVVEHPLALGAAFHCLGALFTTYIFGCAFHAAVPVSLIARCKLLAAPSAGFWKIDSIFFTGQGGSTCHNDGTCACPLPSTAICTAYGFRSQDRAAALYLVLPVASNGRSVFLTVSNAHGLAHSSASSQQLR